MSVAIARSRLTTGNDTTPTAAFSAGSAAAGSLLVAVITCPNTGAITGPAGYSSIAGPYVSSNTNKQLQVFAKVAAGGETSVSATITSGRWGCELVEVTGLDSADVSAIVAGSKSVQADDSNNGGTTVTSYQVDAVDPTDTGEVLMLACFVLSAVPSSSPTWDQSYATLNAPPANCRSFTGWKIGSNLGTQNPTASWTDSVQVLAAHLAIGDAAATVDIPSRGFPRGLTRGLR